MSVASNNPSRSSSCSVAGRESFWAGCRPAPVTFHFGRPSSGVAVLDCRFAQRTCSMPMRMTQPVWNLNSLRSFEEEEGVVVPLLALYSVGCSRNFPGSRSIRLGAMKDSVSTDKAGITDRSLDSPKGVARKGLGNANRRIYATKLDRDGESDKLGGSSGGEKESVTQKKLLTLPTILTLARVAAIPAFLAVFFSNSWWATAATAAVFVLASITDWLDGYLARKMKTSSPFGAFLDPVADKLMVATALVLMCTKPLLTEWGTRIPWLIPVPAIAIISREITMSAVREWAASQGGDVREAVAVNKLGKWKTASQMVALTLLLLGRDGRFDPGGWISGSGVVLLYIAACLSCWSLAVYIRAIWGSFLK